MSRAKKFVPEAAAVFQWAVTRTEPTLAEAAAHFKCSQSTIEGVIDAADIPGAYFGLAVAVRHGDAVYELPRGQRQIEAYYTPDAKGEPA